MYTCIIRIDINFTFNKKEKGTRIIVLTEKMVLRRVVFLAFLLSLSCESISKLSDTTHFRVCACVCVFVSFVFLTNIVLTKKKKKLVSFVTYVVTRIINS